MRTLAQVPTPLRLARGLTLIELMVAVAVGAFLMIGAMTVFMQSQTTFRLNQSVARLQENARFALAAIEPDIRMASFYGLSSRGVRINGRAKTTAANNAVLWPGGPAGCGANWALDLENPIVATNGAYLWPCAPTVGIPQPGTDTVLIRRVNENVVAAGALANNTLYLQSARFQPGQIFAAAVVPAGYTATTSQTNALITRGYYIASQSSQLGLKGQTIPSLHRKSLSSNPIGVMDEEILAGVEDLQIELGVDTDIPDAPNRGAVDRYVNADDPILNPASASYNPNAVILAVRIWLRVRAEDIENGFSDTTEYKYADVDFIPTAAQAPFRRLLVSKTIYLRNARQMS
jgi:type IV pilus assembly protein PilW